MSYKHTRNAYCNCEKVVFDGVGKYNIPELPAVNSDIDNAEWIDFSEAFRSEDITGKVVHFYLEDYQFQRTWNYPDRYVNKLMQAEAVLSPDYSLYADFPKAVQIYNHYRSQWLGAYWDMHGITVIPTLNWSTPDSYEFCFDGVPTKSIVSVSNIGSQRSRKSKDVWLNGYYTAIERLQPTKIYVYGNYNPELECGIPLIIIKNCGITRLRKIEGRE